MKTIVLFEFEGAYASNVMNIHDKYKNVRFSGESFKISERTIHLFDELVKIVFDRLDNMSLSFVTMSDRSIADKVFKEVTSLDGVNLPIVCITSEEMKDETMKRLASNVDRVIWVGPSAKMENSYNCEFYAISTLHEMTNESWLALTEALK